MTPTTPSAPDEVVLAPCPFCGGAVTIEDDTVWLADGVAWIKHAGRPCGLELSAASASELREQWNTRVSIASPQPAGVTDEQVEAALAFWCAKLPKAQREQPIPDKLREHMRGTLDAARLAASTKEDGQ